MDRRFCKCPGEKGIYQIITPAPESPDFKPGWPERHKHEGEWYYRVRMKADGAAPHYHYITGYCPTREKAIAARDARLNPANPTVQQKGQPLKQAVQVYRKQELPTYRYARQQSIDRSLRRFTDYFDSTPLPAVDKNRLEAFLRASSEGNEKWKPLSESSLQILRLDLCLVFDWWLEQESFGLTDNPARKARIRLFQSEEVYRDTDEIRFAEIMEPEQIVRFLSWLQENYDDPAYLLVALLGFTTGARISEIAGLKFKDFCEADHTVRIERQQPRADVITATKTKKIRYSCCPQAVFALLEKVRQDRQMHVDVKKEGPEAFVAARRATLEKYKSESGATLGSAFRQVFTRYKQEAGISHATISASFSFHNTRHTFATHLTEQFPASEQAVSQCCGHAQGNRTTTQKVYIHRKAVDLAAVAQFATYWDQLLEPLQLA